MAVGVNIVSNFDSKGIQKAIKDFQKLETTGDKTAFSLRTLDSAASNGIKNIAKIGAAVGVAAGVIGFKLASAAYESQKALAQTEAIIKATGGAAGISAAQVSKLSEKLSMQIGVDDELIQKSANLLLTFKQVKDQVGVNNDIFTQAVTLSQDLGNVFGSADAAAMQLGKALSDPEKGITALRRAGINFTEAQKDQIAALVASGDLLGAQKLILAEVESQVGGTAAATATGFEIMRVAVGNVAEKFGALLLPAIEKFARFVTEKVVPYLTQLADVIGEKGVGAGIKMLAGDFLNMTTNMGETGNFILGIATAFIALRAATLAFTVAQSLATVATIAFGVAWNATGIGLIASLIAAIVVGLIALYIKFESVRKVVNLIGEVLKFVVLNAIALVYNSFVLLYNSVAQGLNYLIKVANAFGAGWEEIGMQGQMAYTKIGNAAKGATKAIVGVAEVAGGMAAKEGGVQNVAAALKAVGAAAGSGSGGAAKAVETATEKLQKFIDKLKSVTSAQRSYRDASKGVLKADTDLLEAKTKLADAQQYLNDVVKGFGAGSKQAKSRQKELDLAQRGVERAGYGVEGALFAVTDAEKALADLRKDPETSAQAIREAEIKLAEAKLAVSDATDDQTNSANELATAQRLLDEAINGASESSDTYLEANKAMMDAQKAAVDATDQQTAAYERQRDALDNLTKAQNDAVAAKTGVKPASAAAAEVAAGVVLPAPAVGGNGLFASFMQAVRSLHPNFVGLKSTSPVTDSRKAFPALYKTYKDAGLAMAKGGIVTQPTQVLAGEKGAEAIIPLDRLTGGGMTINLTVNAGMGTDAGAVGDQIVSVLQRYNRRNGALPLKVA